MAFTAQDYNDFVRLLTAHPEWRPELRRLVLSDELLALPEIVRDLAEAQRRTEARLEQLAEAQQRTEETLRVLTNRQNQMRGDLLEYKYAQRATGYFASLARRIRVVLPNHLDPATEDNLEAHLTHEELLEVLNLDVLAVGRLRQPPTPDKPEVWLAVEVSAMLDQGDVERAQRRAALLRKAGYRALPVVAGVGLTPEATELLKDAPVALVLDGRSQGWEQALAAAQIPNVPNVQER